MTETLYSGPLGTALTIALVGLLPLAFVALTSFTKVSTVLTIARAAIGAQGIPSNIVVLALSAALSLVAMAPVGTAMMERMAPILDGAAPDQPALVADLGRAARAPLVGFLRANASERELDRFETLARTGKRSAQADIERTDLVVVVPAFLVTELLEAFSLGFAIFLPFLVVDFLVANVLGALGLTALTPSQISLPFKLLLFVSADGWGLLSEALVSGYVVP